MYKKFIIFLSEYGVLFQGVLLTLLAFKEEGIIAKIVFFGVATFLLLISVGVTKVLKVLIHKKGPHKELSILSHLIHMHFHQGMQQVFFR